MKFLPNRYPDFIHYIWFWQKKWEKLFDFFQKLEQDSLRSPKTESFYPLWQNGKDARLTRSTHFPTQFLYRLIFPPMHYNNNNKQKQRQQQIFALPSKVLSFSLKCSKLYDKPEQLNRSKPLLRKLEACALGNAATIRKLEVLGSTACVARTTRRLLTSQNE